MSDNIQEAEVGSGTKVADTKQSEKRAQLTLKAIQLRLKQEKERAALQQQKKSLSVKEDIGESFSPSQIAALKAEYSKINGIDPASDTYKKLIAMLDRLDLKTLQSLAGAEIKFVSKLAQNRVARKNMKEEVESIDELSTNKLADYKKKAGENASAADKAGDTKTGNKRFSGIMKATRKQFDNDAKQKTEELSPKQKAMDKNKNGKIDGSDLAKLRGEELSTKQKALDKNNNGKIDGSDLAKLRNKSVPESDAAYGAWLKAKEEKRKMDNISSADKSKLSAIVAMLNKEKKKQPQGADFAAQRRKERLASNGRMDEQEMSDGDKSSMALRALVAKKKLQQTSGKNKSQAFIDKMVNRSKLLNQPKSDDEYTRKVVQHLKKKYNEETVNEKSDYEVYHKDYSGAVQAAIKQAEKRGYEVDVDDWHDKVATGPKKPSSGKTNSFSINLMKDGKPSKKKLQMQVYNMDNHKYELNMYIEEVQQGVAEGSGDKKPYPNTWHDVDPKLGKQVDKMSPEEKVKKGYANPSILKKKKEQGVAEEVQKLDELNKDTLHSYAKKSEKDQDDQFDKIGKGIRDNDPKSANKAGHKFSMRSIGQNRAEKRLAKEAASPAQQAAIAIAMKKAGKKPKDMEESDAYDKNVKPSDKPHDKEAAAKRAKLAALAARKKMSESIVDKIKAIKRGMQAKAKADDHFDKAGDPKNANASKDLKKAVRYHNLLNKEEVVLEAKKSKTFKNIKKKMKEEETPNKSTIKKGDMLTGKREPIEINPELKEPAR